MRVTLVALLATSCMGTAVELPEGGGGGSASAGGGAASTGGGAASTGGGSTSTGGGPTSSGGGSASSGGGSTSTGGGAASTGGGSTSSGGGAASSGGGSAAGAAVTVSSHLLVDQFGYLPADAKVAVIRDPLQGFNTASRFSPGSTYQLRRWSTGAVVHSGAPVPWSGGATQASSGDRGWWYDFSSVTEPGSYFVFDVDRQVGSGRFEISATVYREVLKAAVKVFFYQRSGFAKPAANAGACWADAAAFLGPNQDPAARSVVTKAAGSARDLRGGWFDAGDTNKYVTFAHGAVHRLLAAYRERPAVWTDDFGIPESGNGIPDLLDELKWEIDWLKRMQQPSGSAFLKVGTIDYNDVTPPGADARPRYYVPECTSATIAVASMFAHAAVVYGQVSALQGEVADLRARAISAWTQYQAAGTRETACDSGEVKSGDADWDATGQNRAAVVAAVYLYALTQDATYRTFVDAQYQSTRPWADIGFTRYEPEQGEALLYYTTLPGATAAVRQAILARKSSDSAYTDIYSFIADKDLYRAFITDATYHWGSNQPRANNGTSNVDMVTFNLQPGQAASFRQRALELLHYFHGVNPLATTYLTNMYGLGAERSANQIYHTWFRDGSRWDDALSSECGPPPGYVPGGPNTSSSGGKIPASEPAQKCYRDWNTAWPENSWEVTEPGIYYQAAYVKLLSAFVQ